MTRDSGRDFQRSERVGAELMRSLTVILREEVKDPRLGSVTIQEVRVSRDLSHAKVYFTCFPLDEETAAREALLNGPLAGFLRHELSRTERLRTIPQLHFVHDESIHHGEQLSALIDEAVAAIPPEHQTDADAIAATDDAAAGL
ncbi:30S ribosome-binding factor RbfA [Thiorhodovibrio frisius]|uniref:Ribosome-binding factor A n=1 Tax=Thiorhodovibrio frisius TaxID=631362 RepID=H8Z4A3_9GAMM|nr:30S ribosome-binding factor RbfA [Thiorhodovibrio frisius]EIC20160.1 ribosome-binding factor A [Thiorhodovibrio frisius]WPL20897.1 Ribosome-binding factor A [Thiorhodovibrio frisius]